jgi:hypothetical protein
MLFLNQTKVLLGVIVLSLFCGCNQSTLKTIKDENGKVVAILNSNDLMAIEPDGTGSFTVFREGKGNFHIAADISRVSEQVK